MKDTIYREDAIDAVKFYEAQCDPYPRVIESLQQLPSAEPDIIRCKECKEFRRWIDTDITFCDRTESEVKEDDFCSRAQRRTDD